MTPYFSRFWFQQLLGIRFSPRLRRISWGRGLFLLARAGGVGAKTRTNLRLLSLKMARGRIKRLGTLEVREILDIPKVPQLKLMGEGDLLSSFSTSSKSRINLDTRKNRTQALSWHCVQVQSIKPTHIFSEYVSLLRDKVQASLQQKKGARWIINCVLGVSQPF